MRRAELSVACVRVRLLERLIVTFPELMAVLGRRWYVPVVTLLCAIALTYSLMAGGARFVTRTQLAFSMPWSSSTDPWSLSDPNLVAFAGAIATEVNEGKPSLWYSSPDAPYYGAGLSQAILLGVPNEGGQWMKSFPTAVIQINVVGPSREWVEAQQQRLVTEVERATQERQANAGPAEQRIRVSVEPGSTQIVKVTPTRTSRLAAVLGILAAALIVGSWGASLLDRNLARRRRKLQIPDDLVGANERTTPK